MAQLPKSDERGRPLDPFGVGAIAAAGTLAAHQIGYFATGGSSVTHSYLGWLGLVVILCACLAAWSAALHVLQRIPGRAPSLATLVAVQAALFATMEIGERVAVDAELSSLATTPVLVGLALQPLAAFLALRILATAKNVLEMVSCHDDRPPTRPCVVWTFAVWSPRSRNLPGCLRLRGPPVP